MMRQSSIQRYATLIPELEAATGQKLPWNCQGILMLCFEADRSRWQQLAELRRSQGWQLELWDLDKLQANCPQICNSRITGAVYSPDDRQVDPTALTLALVQAAQQRGVTFRFDATVSGFESLSESDGSGTIEPSRVCHHLHLADESLPIDAVVIAAGLGSTLLTQTAQRPVDLRPVLGQALRVSLENPLGHANFQPVITGEDTHIVPLGNGEYWVGATVEFPIAGEIVADPDRLQEVWQAAIALCPALKWATILQTWSGLRPRPSDRPAPVIERLSGYNNIFVATGHYRNGILLAPATALAVRETILATMKAGEK
jgi:glycine/D-amino acid oxidase-like deaminating enzyme